MPYVFLSEQKLFIVQHKAGYAHNIICLLQYREVLQNVNICPDVWYEYTYVLSPNRQLLAHGA